jgi:hypothetical protein
MLELQKIKRDINWLIDQIKCLIRKSDLNSPLSATAWSENHNGPTEEPYDLDCFVWFEGNVYKSLSNGNIYPPTNTTHWANLGLGHLLLEEQTDWNSTTGRSFLKNKPNLSQYALDSNVVHRTGNETIAGRKTFTDSVQIIGDQKYLTVNSADNETGAVVISTDESGYPYIQLGLTANENTGTFRADNINTNSTYQLPNKSGTMALLSDVGLSSIGISMPSAFTVTNSPIITNGTIEVTGSGLPSQYIRGDGQLASFPEIAGGGGGQVYYCNGGVSQGTIDTNNFYQLSTGANLGTSVNFTSGTVNDVAFANFITDIGKPTQEVIPAGVWIFQCYLSASASNILQVYATIEVYNGSTFYVLATSLIEVVTNGTTVDLYTFTCAVPEYAPLTTSDRIAIRFYPKNLTAGNTITLYTQNSNLSSIQSTFTTGLAALNGLTTASQLFATGITGTDFGIVSSESVHTFNIPNAGVGVLRGLITNGTQTISGAKTFNNRLYLKHTNSALIGDITVFSNGFIFNRTPTNIAFQAIAGHIQLHKYNDSSLWGRIETTLITANRTYALPDASGTLALTSDIPAQGVTSLNGLITNTQTFVIGTTGTDFGIVSTGSIHTFNLPDASVTARGVVTVNDQSFSGLKNFTDNITVNTIRIWRGSNNTATNIGIGLSTLLDTTGNQNTVIGYQAASALLSASSFTTAIGHQSLKNVLGNNNTAIGNLSGLIIQGGSQNTFIGSGAGGIVGQLVAVTNSTAIGYQAITTKNNQVVIGNGAVTETVLNGNVLVDSLFIYAGDSEGGSPERCSIVANLGLNPQNRTGAILFRNLYGATVGYIEADIIGLGKARIMAENVTTFIDLLLPNLSGTLALTSDVNNRLVVEKTTGHTLTNADSGGIIIFKTTATQTLNIPLGLADGFECTFVTLAGITLTVPSVVGITLNNATGTTMAGGLSFTLKRMLATDTFIVTGNL